MSYWTGYCGDALILSMDEYRGFLSEYINANPDYSSDEIDAMIMEQEPLTTGNGKTISLALISDDCCEGITKYFYQEDREPVLLGNTVVMFAEHQRSPFSPVYSSLNEMKEEYQEKIGAYLPDHFDWDAHMGWIQYACYA